MTQSTNSATTSTIKAIGFVPELKLDASINRKLKLAEGLYILPNTDERTVTLRNEIISRGYMLNEGSYLYFDGNLKEDGTAYEIFQGYCLALTFYYPAGRATCRVVKELGSDKAADLFIDTYDKFGYELDEVITLKASTIKKVLAVFTRVETQLATEDFNPLRNSVEFFILFLAEKQIRTRLLYLSICLESVFLDEDVEGIAYKLAIRCARFLHKYTRSVNMASVFEEVKNGYALRSKIIHGSDYRKESNKIIRKKSMTSELDHIEPLENIVKNTLSQIFLNEDLYNQSCKGAIGTFIDNNFILMD